MTPSTIVELSEVSGKPKVKMALPPLRIGDKIHLKFRLSRQNGGRSEQLDVDGDYQVRGMSVDASSGVAHQQLAVDAVSTSPSWKAVKKVQVPLRKLGPARVPPMVIE
jgi:hypothetical protein